MIFKCVLFVLSLFLFCENATSFTCNKNSTRQIKTYIIDLDKPASERFIQPASDFVNEISALVDAQK